MTTNIEYQVLGNTLRIRQTKDVVTDLNTFDAITSPNNSVIHGGILCNVDHDSLSNDPPADITGPTTNMAILSPNSVTSVNDFSVALSSGYSNANVNANDLYGSVTIGETTFYGTKIGRFESGIGKQTGTSNTYLWIKTANFKVTVIRYISASGEIVTEEYTQASLNVKLTGSVSSSTFGRITMNIPKATDDLLLFIGIENIFETA